MENQYTTHCHFDSDIELDKDLCANSVSRGKSLKVGCFQDSRSGRNSIQVLHAFDAPHVRATLDRWISSTVDN